MSSQNGCVVAALALVCSAAGAGADVLTTADVDIQAAAMFARGIGSQSLSPRPNLPLHGEVEGTATLPDSTASLGLKMFASASVGAFINTGGDVSVHRGFSDYTPLGQNVNGSGTILGKWTEFDGIGSNKIQVVWKTDNGEEFLPANATVEGQPAIFLGWRFGGADPVDWRPQVDPATIKILSAVVGISSDGGVTVTTFPITSSFPPPWDGTDVGLTLPLAGQGINYIFTVYEFEFLPAPGTVATLGLALMVASRRRR